MKFCPPVMGISYCSNYKLLVPEVSQYSRSSKPTKLLMRAKSFLDGVTPGRVG